MNKTKIVSSIGPACKDVKTLEKMIECGMSVARFNMSHGTHESHKELIDNLKTARKNKNSAVAIMIDTKGPEIRVEKFEKGKINLKSADSFVLTTEKIVGNNERVSVTYSNFAKIVKVGTKILLNDGVIKLEVQKVKGKDVICKVVDGGELSDHKSINLPGVKTQMQYLSNQDKEDLKFAKSVGADYVAISFVGTAQDVESVKNFLRQIKFAPKIISKIESEEGVQNFDKILAASDGIMVARGDLGVEVDFVKIPILQKQFVDKCNKAGKISVTATQMLESMITNARPTRAEISDVANAVFDGSTAIMLSGETASGKHPIQAVSTMRDIALESEAYAHSNQNPLHTHNTSKSLGYAAYALSQTKGVQAILVVTQSGKTAENISRFRPTVPIIACTPNENVFHRLSMLYGVVPVMDKKYQDMQQVNESSLVKALQTGLVEKGQKVVLVSGQKAGKSGTNILEIRKI